MMVHRQPGIDPHMYLQDSRQMEHLARKPGAAAFDGCR
jgi:hypothetical protein